MTTFAHLRKDAGADRRRGDDYDEPTLRDKFAAVAGEVGWVRNYRAVGSLPTGTHVDLDERPACGPR